MKLFSPAEPIAEAETKPSTLNIQPSTSEDMEVRHHTHPGHHKKNWKDYFWEFLMLFLAVFCGFLAEYQLEHKIEKDRAKEYASLLMEDLKNDSRYQRKYAAKDGDIKVIILMSLYKSKAS
ncbi:MAG: hypothetical protein ACR2KX_16120 [Chitinophagaceae bacterium]